MIAISGFLTAIECNKFVFGPTPLLELTARGGREREGNERGRKKRKGDRKRKGQEEGRREVMEGEES